MKIIDLLNKIANGENIKNIKYKNHKYEYYNGDFREEIDGAYDSNWLFANEIIDLDNLNDEVEIIEEENKIPEKLPYYDYSKIMSSNDKLKTIELMLEKHEKRLNDNWKKINEIIDYLKSKGE